MDELAKIDKKRIENMIYEIRGKQVMLGSDLAKLYQCANGTKTINLAVKRNIERFPVDFYFQSTEEETKLCSKFQSETLNTKGDLRGTNIKKLPYVFTEQGIAMLATILRTHIAAEVSIQIMRAFVTMRKYISSNLLEQKYINNQVMKNTDDIRLLKETFSKFKEKSNHLFFEGQIYDAYSKILSIFKTAKKSLIIIDGYADNTVLDMISKLKVQVTLITKNKPKLSKIDIEKYNSQYDNLKLIYSDSFHDRFIILDNKTIYHCGASINHAGKRAFAIDVIEDEEMKKALLKKINELKKL